jgi:hypothetical protein
MGKNSDKLQQLVNRNNIYGILTQKGATFAIDWRIF